MEEVGVEAVVKGLQAFLGDMRKVNGALDGLRPSGTLLQQMFENVGSAISGFGSSVQRVVETALGVLLRDAINFAIGQFKNLVGAIVEAGNEFQLLKIRLTGLNLNDTVNGIQSFDQAMAEAVAMTQEEITWLQTLGSATPFDPAQIANTYTMARSFGFTSEEAKRLTTDILNYTAAMGLGNETLFLVIQNLGQMVQRGKITGTEIRDLARGSYLPLADVLERVAKNMGITVKELTQRISTPEGIPAQEFVKAYEEMIEQEPRFIGAAGRLSRALVPAAQNIKELFTSIFGLNVATPIFDILGEKVAGLIDEFVTFNEQGDLIKTGKWDNLVAAATNLGIALGEVIKKLLSFLPSTQNFADLLINSIQGVAVWIRDNKDNIVNFFIGIANAINTYVIIPFQRISAWVVTNWPTITAFFQSLGEIITTVFGNLFGGKFAEGDFLGGLLEGIKKFMEFVTTNKEQIAIWATWIIKVVVAIELLVTAFNIAIGIIGAVLGAIIAIIGGLAAFVATVTGVIAAIGFLAANWVVLVAIIGVVIAAVVAVVNTIRTILTISSVSSFIQNSFAPAISTAFQTMRNNIANSVSGIVNQIQGINWGGVGSSIIRGIANGVSSTIGILVNAVLSAARSAYQAALRYLGIQSPSKLFEEVGSLTMEGFSQGVQKYANVAAGAMTNAMQRVSAPAISMPSIIQSVMAPGGGGTVNNNNNRSYNLTVNSSASAEPIVQDFNMLQSLSGG